MSWSKKRVLFIFLGFCLVLLFGVTGFVYSGEPAEQSPGDGVRLPLLIGHMGISEALERPEVAFDHDRHTKALKHAKKADCKVCHIVEEKDDRLVEKKVQIFGFPKFPYNAKDRKSIRDAYHAGCGNCHSKMTAEGKKTGPDIGLCGKCHVRKPLVRKVTWGWQPIFNYDRHNRHLNVLEKTGIARDKTCAECHHIFDEKQKKLTYKKDTENSCRACHKAKDEKNARAMRKVAHARCIGCHLKTAEALLKRGQAPKTGKEVGPFECKGCHGEHKILSPEEIIKIPRLVRGQKDVMDVAVKDVKKARMKLVAFNHKAHEPRAQFCNTCHHHSLEKCSNCHTEKPDLKTKPHLQKGGGVSFERAFHKSGAVQSCAGCHETAKKSRNCAGCHQWLLTSMPKASCPVCHRGPSEGKPIKAPAPLPLVFDKEKVPEKVLIKDLENEYKPAELPHQKIVAKLTTISNKSSLALFFHSQKGEQALCEGCHHRTDPGSVKKVPKCSSCHGIRFNPKELGKPGILASYHRQCMGCHEAMGQKPKSLECVKCHAAKEPEKNTPGKTSGTAK